MDVQTIRYLTQDELKRFFSVIKSKRDRAIFFLAYRHGLRASEIGLLRRDDLDFEKGRIYIQRLKGSISQTYPIQADEIKVLKSYLRTRSDQRPILFPSKQGTPIDRTTLHKLTKKYGEQADIPKDKRYFHYTFHCFSHE